MKKKLKKIKEEVAEAKKLWAGAKKAKKGTEEIKTLHDAYTKLVHIVDEAEAGDAKDDDEIEIPKDEAKGKTADDGEKTVTSEELQTLLAETIEAQLKKSNLPTEHKDQVTNESIKAIVLEVLKAHSKDGGKTVPAADFKEIAGEVIKEQLAQIKKGSKAQHQTDDDPDGDPHEGKGMTIELPCAHRKGNLPVHMKQLLNIMLKKPQDDGISEAQLLKAKSLGDRIVAKYVNAARSQKAMTSTGAGTGDEWVPTDISSELQRRFFLSSDLAALFAAREIDMPSQPYEYPLATTRPTFYLETTENVAATPSDPGTSKIVLDAKKMMGRTDFSYEVEEDSLIPILPFVQESLAEAAADAYESAVINGDTTAVHMDSDTEMIPKAAERAFMGFRKLALSVTELKKDLSTGGINEANLRAMKKGMRKYGVKLRDLVWITGSGGISDMQGITNVTTVEKYGPRATILTGELASFLGIPIITSEHVREDLNSNGVYDGITTTKGSILLVNLAGFLPGRRREFTVEVDRDIKTQTKFVVASFRRAFGTKETPSANIRWLQIGYNYNS
jgi:HK97 family phage major capsid protein